MVDDDDNKRGPAGNAGLIAGVVGTVVLAVAGGTQAPRLMPKEEAPPPNHVQKLKARDPNAPPQMADLPVPDGFPDFKNKPKVPGR